MVIYGLNSVEPPNTVNYLGSKRTTWPPLSSSSSQKATGTKRKNRRASWIFISECCTVPERRQNDADSSFCRR